MFSFASTNPDDLRDELWRMKGEFARFSGVIGGWTRGGGNDPSFDFMHARRGNFDFMPLHYGRLKSTTTQSIPNDAQTALQFDIFSSISAEPAIDWSTAATSEVRLIGRPETNVFLLWGHVEFAASSVGYREVAVERNWGGSSVETEIPIRVQASTTITVLPFSVGWTNMASTTSDDATEHATLEVRQNSGGALNVTSAVLHVVRVY